MPISQILTSSLASNLVAPSATTATTATTATALSTASGSAPSYSARAWVNFNGTGTVAIRSSGNVSSITDNGTGNYTINFATPLPDGNYAGVGSSIAFTIDGIGSTVRSTTQCTILNVDSRTYGRQDSPGIYFAAFR